VPVPPLAAMGLDRFSDFEQMDAGGITYLDTCFARVDHAHIESLHFHELVHVLQWRYLGPDRFLASYAVAHLLAGGFDKNLLEVMADYLQRQFSANGLAGNVEPLIRLQIDQHIAPVLGRALSMGR
jgi:hypothetical protein